MTIIYEKEKNSFVIILVFLLLNVIFHNSLLKYDVITLIMNGFLLPKKQIIDKASSNKVFSYL